ncbi:MAG: acetyl-CoA C-acyltransferase [Bacilli bacterium]|nr:acetyl-CoA C-acyltransferase [Bacilli bacterium]
MNIPVVVNSKRTIIGKKGGVLRGIPPEQMVSKLIQALLLNTGIKPEDISDVILGNVVGPGGNLARLSALTAGLPIGVPGLTVDRQCGSGLEAINLACRLIQAGAGEIYLAGGVESTSLSAFPTRARFSPDSIGDPDMGICAENVAEKYRVTRENQDSFAALSYEKAYDSILNNRFASEIVSIVPFDRDEGLKPRMNYQKLIQRARPIFKEAGTVTAANSCGLSDGASLSLILSEKKAKELGLTIYLQFKDAVTVGVNPNMPGIGPVPAVKKLLFQSQLSIEEIDVVELNEAFAAQVVASAKELQIPFEKLNKGGGAIAFGHPYGASGAILVTRLHSEMKCIPCHYGVATIGIGGGLGIATLFEKYVEEK